MWIISTVGFFSVVQKQGQAGLTIRSRVLADLERLREQYLPTLGKIIDFGGTDYPFRAVASRAAVAAAVGKIAKDVRYDNFKKAIAEAQGPDRHNVYGEVWRVLLRLQTIKTQP